MGGGADDPPGPRPLSLPYLAGERCPLWSPAVRGAWMGLSMDHTPEQVAVAIFEGVALVLGWIRMELRRLGLPLGTVYSAGKAGGDEPFGRLRATVYELPVHRLDQPDAALFGAALIAAAVIGETNGVRSGLERWAHARWIAEPDCRMIPAYRERLGEFRRASRLLVERLGYGS